MIFQDDFWQKRAKAYDKLHWQNRQEYLQFFIDACRLSGKEKVLDLGTGTGTVAFAIDSLAKQVTGVDFSPDMLLFAGKKNNQKNINFRQADIRKLPFADNSFDRITARMVFHHLLWGLNRAMGEIRRVLKPGGLFCLSEGVPPDRCVENFYREVFALKEKRKTFYPEDLEKIIKSAGLILKDSRNFYLKRCSIRNWLNNTGNLSEVIKEKIFSMHLNLSKEGKKAYNMEIRGSDCFIDMKFTVVTGLKTQNYETG